MSVQDPGAATSTGQYPSQRRCSCTHSEALHAYGRHKGSNVRKACNVTTADDGACGCRLFVAVCPVHGCPAGPERDGKSCNCPSPCDGWAGAKDR